MNTMALDFPNAFAGIVAGKMTSDNKHRVQRYLTVNSCLGRQMATDVVCALEKCERQLAERDAQVTGLNKEVAFWAGEGQETRPEIIEWRTLAAKSNHTPEQAARITELSRMIRVESEDAPELRTRLAERDVEIERLKAENIGLQNSHEVCNRLVDGKNAEIKRLEAEVQLWKRVRLLDLQDEVARMKPVVDAAVAFCGENSSAYSSHALGASVDTYRKGASDGL